MAQRNSCIQHLANDTYLKIRSCYIEISRHFEIPEHIKEFKGYDCMAALIALYEHRHNVILESIDNEKTKNKLFKVLPEAYEQGIGGNHLEKKMLGVFSSKHIRKANEVLEHNGIIKISKKFNGNNNSFAESTAIFNVDLINTLLDAFGRNTLPKNFPMEILPKGYGNSTIGGMVEFPNKIINRIILIIINTYKEENQNFEKNYTQIEPKNIVQEVTPPAAAESPKKVILDEMKMKVEFLPHEEVYENLINHFELNDERKLKIFQDRHIDEKSLSESEFVILLKDFSIYYIGSRKYTGTANVGHSIPEFERWLGWQSNDINDGSYFEDKKKTLKREAKDNKLKTETAKVNINDRSRYEMADAKAF